MVKSTCSQDKCISKSMTTDFTNAVKEVKSLAQIYNKWYIANNVFLLEFTVLLGDLHICMRNLVWLL